MGVRVARHRDLSGRAVVAGAVKGEKLPEVPLWLWSYLLTAVGLVGLYAAGSKRSWGWLVGLFAQILWIAYALATGQYGFLISACAYGFVYARNFTAWQRKPESVMTR